MSICLVLPLKSLREGKSRLAAVLDHAARAELIEALLDHVLEQAQRFPGLRSTMLMSPCAQACAYAARRGVRVFKDDAPGLNLALAQARMEVRATGVDKLMIVPCDLPLLIHDDLRELAAAASARVAAIAPDRNGEGTNGLCLPADVELDFLYGPHSFNAHRRAIDRLGLEARTIERPGFAFDVDTPRDLEQLRGLRAASMHAQTQNCGCDRTPQREN